MTDIQIIDVTDITKEWLKTLLAIKLMPGLRNREAALNLRWGGMHTYESIILIGGDQVNYKPQSLEEIHGDWSIAFLN